MKKMTAQTDYCLPLNAFLSRVQNDVQSRPHLFTYTDFRGQLIDAERQSQQRKGCITKKTRNWWYSKRKWTDDGSPL